MFEWLYDYIFVWCCYVIFILVREKDRWMDRREGGRRGGREEGKIIEVRLFEFEWFNVVCKLRKILKEKIFYLYYGGIYIIYNILRINV